MPKIHLKPQFVANPPRSMDKPKIADVITFQGRSIDELKQALADSIDDYLEFCTLSGKTPQKPYSGKFNVRILPELHQRIVTRASHDGKSLNMWVAEALDHAASANNSHS